VPEIADSTLVILTCALLGVAVLVMLAVFGISRTLRRIELRLAEMQNRDGAGDEWPSAGENPGGGAFETFLAEDPERKQMPKKERFAAYRKWRQEKGLNWSNPR
jgi:hypothetical protein